MQSEFTFLHGSTPISGTYNNYTRHKEVLFDGTQERIKTAVNLCSKHWCSIYPSASPNLSSDLLGGNFSLTEFMPDGISYVFRQSMYKMKPI